MISKGKPPVYRTYMYSVQLEAIVKPVELGWYELSSSPCVLWSPSWFLWRLPSPRRNSAKRRKRSRSTLYIRTQVESSSNGTGTTCCYTLSCNMFYALEEFIRARAKHVSTWWNVASSKLSTLYGGRRQKLHPYRSTRHACDVCRQCATKALDVELHCLSWYFWVELRSTAISSAGQAGQMCWACSRDFENNAVPGASTGISLLAFAAHYH